jgi:RNA polymerase sigma factor (sigma-70 family)
LTVSDTLIKQCINGDRRSQNELYKCCYSMLISVCWRYATSKDEAVEYMNLGFVKILTNLAKRQESVPFESWCRRIMINTMIDEYRKTRNYSKHVKIVEHERLPAGAETADLSDLQMDLVDLIRSKVPMLPPMTAKVFNLYAIDGYKHQEIAELLAISEGTSMWHFSEAKRRIREMISFK